MDAYINESFHRELLIQPDPIKVSEALKIEHGRGLAEEFLEDLLPIPYASAETAGEDLSYLLLQKILFPSPLP